MTTGTWTWSRFFGSTRIQIRLAVLLVICVFAFIFYIVWRVDQEQHIILNLQTVKQHEPRPFEEIVTTPLIWKPASQSPTWAYMVSAPHVVHSSGLIVVHAYGHILKSERLHLNCTFLLPNSFPVNAEDVSIAGTIYKHPHSPTKFAGNNLGYDAMLNTFFQLPRSVWLFARQQGNITIEVHGTWSFTPTVLVLPIDLHFNNANNLTMQNQNEFDEEDGNNSRLVHCSGSIFFDSNFNYMFQRMIEFFEYYHQIGVAHFFVYLQSLPSKTDHTTLLQLEHYVKRGLVTWIDFSKVPPGAYYHGQMLAQNDCLFRTRRTATYGLFLDFDEFLFFPQEVNITTEGIRPGILLKKAVNAMSHTKAKPNVVMTNMMFEPWNFVTYACSTNCNLDEKIKPHNGMMIPKFTWKASRRSWDAPKYITRLDRTTFVAVHIVGHVCNGRCMAINVPSSEIVKYHFKYGAMAVPMVCRILTNETIVYNHVFDRYDPPHTLIYDDSFSKAFATKMQPLVNRVWMDVYQQIPPA